MSTINDGGPAFPCMERGGNGLDLTHAGMSLRDYFAAKAMHALVVEPPWEHGSTASVHKWSEGFTGNNPLDRFAFASYAMADAMLAARQKGGA